MWKRENRIRPFFSHYCMTQGKSEKQNKTIKETWCHHFSVLSLSWVIRVLFLQHPEAYNLSKFFPRMPFRGNNYEGKKGNANAHCTLGSLIPRSKALYKDKKNDQSNKYWK
jgi:hypothetical protein